MPNKVRQLPKKAMNSFMFFFNVCREEYKRRHPDEKISRIEIRNKCSERWKVMSEEEKKRFNQMAEEDKKRYELELNISQPILAVEGRGKLVGKEVAMDTKKKKPRFKDVNAPRRVVQPFMWFSKESRQKVLAANPDFTNAEIAKEVSRRWSEMDPEEKEKYYALTKRDKERYAREKEGYKKKKKLADMVPSGVLDSDDSEDAS